MPPSLSRHVDMSTLIDGKINPDTTDEANGTTMTVGK